MKNILFIIISFLSYSPLNAQSIKIQEWPSPAPYEFFDIAVSSHGLYAIATTEKYGKGVYYLTAPRPSQDSTHHRWVYWKDIKAIDIAIGLENQPVILTPEGKVRIYRNSDRKLRSFNPLPNGAKVKTLGDLEPSNRDYLIWIIDTSNKPYLVSRNDWTPKKQTGLLSPNKIDQVKDEIYYLNGNILLRKNINASRPVEIANGLVDFDISRLGSIAYATKYNIKFKKTGSSEWKNYNHGAKKVGATHIGFFYIDNKKALFYKTGNEIVNLTLSKSAPPESNPDLGSPSDNESDSTVEQDVEKIDGKGNSAFMRAAASGNETKMIDLIKGGADITKTNKEGETALFHAVRNKQSEAVQLLLDQSLEVNKKNKSGKTVLQIAIDQNDFPMATNLIEAGANPNATNALDQAIRSEKEEMVNFLLDLENIKPEAGLTAAATVNDYDLFIRLIEKGARLSDNKPIDEAIKNNNALIVRKALENGGDANYTLKKAIDANSKAILRGALESGAESEPAWRHAISTGDTGLFNTCMEKYQGNEEDALGPALQANQLEMAEICLLASANADPHIEPMVNAGNEEAVAKLLMYGGNANTALSAAVNKNNASIARLAFKNKATISSSSYIKTACTQNNLEMVKLLLDNGANSNDGLEEAITVKSESIVKELLKNGATPDTGMSTAVNQGSGNIVGLLLSKGADGKKSIYLQTAAAAGNAEIVNLLLDAGSNPDDGLQVAVQNGHAPVVNSLIESNADFSDPMLLKTSVEKNYTDISLALLHAGTPINYVQPDGGNLLNMASQLDNLPIARVLTQKGIEVNKTNSQGFTPLHLAANNSSSSMINLLVENKAMVNALSNDKNSALHYSCKLKDISSARILVNNSADVNVVNSSGDYPLHLAVRHKNNIDLAKLLVKNGADINAKNGENKTPRKIAKGGKLKRYLKDNGAEK